MKQIGKVSEIWRYPVKGMGGESLGRCVIGPGGLENDRLWALRDTKREEIQSCKFRPDLLKCRASSSSQGGMEIEFPSGLTVASDDPAIHQHLSDLVGHESTLESLPSAAEVDFFRRFKNGPKDWLDELKETFIREPGEPLPDFTDFPQQAQDFVTVPGSFFLVSPIHIITSATMDHMRGMLPEADWDIRRLRPNIVIETDENLTGLAEQEWIGKPLTIGGLKIQCTGTAVRCGAVTRTQPGISEDKSMLRSIVKEAEQNLGIYGRAEAENVISVGDAVYV